MSEIIRLIKNKSDKIEQFLNKCTILSLYEQKLQTEDILFLIKALKVNTTIESIDFRTFFFLQEKSFFAIKELLCVNNMIKQISLDISDINNQDIIYLIEGVQKNKMLKELSLFLGDCLSDESLNPDLFGDLLKYCSLVKFSLTGVRHWKRCQEYTIIGNKFINGIKENKTLQTLILDAGIDSKERVVSFTPQEFNALFSALHGNKTLRCLSLRYHTFGKILLSLERAIVNSVLSEVNLEGTDITEKNFQTLKTAIEKNIQTGREIKLINPKGESFTLSGKPRIYSKSTQTPSFLGKRGRNTENDDQDLPSKKKRKKGGCPNDDRGSHNNCTIC